MEDIFKLDILLKKFEHFSKETNLYALELKEYKSKYMQYLQDIKEPKVNDHYISCVWSSPKVQSGPDTCKCFYLLFYPHRWCKEIVNFIGLDYILYNPLTV